MIIFMCFIPLFLFLLLLFFSFYNLTKRSTIKTLRFFPLQIKKKNLQGLWTETLCKNDWIRNSVKQTPCSCCYLFIYYKSCNMYYYIKICDGKYTMKKFVSSYNVNARKRWHSFYYNTRNNSDNDQTFMCKYNKVYKYLTSI